MISVHKYKIRKVQAWMLHPKYFRLSTNSTSTSILRLVTHEGTFAHWRGIVYVHFQSSSFPFSVQHSLRRLHQLYSHLKQIVS